MDSEILIDLDKGTALFDYSLNRFQDEQIDSNNSFFDFGNNIEYETKAITKKAETKKLLSRIKFLFKYMVVDCLYRHFSALRPRIQYLSQELTILYHKRYFGIKEYTLEGQYSSKELTYHLPMNLWFEYELEGDYREKIKSIELKRRFVKTIHELGIFDQQDGWNLLFEFHGIPMHGKCIIRYL